MPDHARGSKKSTLVRLTAIKPKVGPDFDPYPAGRFFTRRQILTSNTSTTTYHAALSRMIGMTSIGIKLKKNPLSIRRMLPPGGKGAGD